MWSEFSVSTEAPCVQGHFPGMPLVPGAWLLGRVDAELRVAYPGWYPAGFKKVKFLAPLAPAQTAQLSFDDSGFDDSDWRKVKVRILGPAGEVLQATALLHR